MKLCSLNAAILWLCMPLFAQPHSLMTTGAIQGVAQDSTGAAIPGVTITLRHLGIGISRTYRTSSKGLFTAALLPIGTYELSAQLMSFAGFRIPTITVTSGQTRAVEVVMKPSSFSTRIEVQDRTDAANLFQSKSSISIDNSQVPSIPIDGWK